MTLSQEQHKSEREEFEAWALSEGHAYRDAQHGVCWYEGGARSRQWQGWQAGRASMLRPIPEVEGWACPKCGVERFGPLPACMQAGCPPPNVEPMK